VVNIDKLADWPHEIAKGFCLSPHAVSGSSPLFQVAAKKCIQHEAPQNDRHLEERSDEGHAFS
jgi:hypothetical protein